MALRDAVEAIIENWTEVSSALDPRHEAMLVAALQDVVTSSPADRTAAMARAVGLVAPLLSSEHPVLVALEAESTLFVSAAPDRRDALGSLESRLETIRTGWHDEPPPSDRDAALLAEPALSPAELRARDVDWTSKPLVRLVGPDGSVQLPAFQFDEGGRPRSVVLAVNDLLDADTDPWGVADWWLRPHSWLGGPPVGFLGGPSEAVLIDLVRAELAEE